MYRLIAMSGTIDKKSDNKEELTMQGKQGQEHNAVVAQVL
jgi:hypothetical protein